MIAPFDLNLLTRMWHLVTTSAYWFVAFASKLIKLVMVQVVVSVKNVKCFFTLNEKCFLTLILMRSKLHNMLTAHLPLVFCMFAQHFYII
jgi:hypothetical protein